MSQEKLILDGTDDTVNATGRTNAGGFVVEETSGGIFILESDGYIIYRRCRRQIQAHLMNWLMWAIQ